MKDYKVFSKRKMENVSYAHTESVISTSDTYVSHHTHSNSYEILLFIKGEGNFTVEGVRYPLAPMDLIIARNNEFHSMTQAENTVYERIVINIELDFFERYNCKQYKDIFENRKAGRGNLIPSKTVMEKGIYKVFERMEKYINEGGDDAVISSSLVEILYLVNKYGENEAYKKAEINSTVEKIIEYINSNLSSPINLDSISKELYLSKYHLCRIFKEHTGYTINRYIANKRILMVKKLCSEGESLSRASETAGFESYSNFYKTYTKATGCSPKEGIFRR